MCTPLYVSVFDGKSPYNRNTSELHSGAVQAHRRTRDKFQQILPVQVCVMHEECVPNDCEIRVKCLNYWREAEMTLALSRGGCHHSWRSQTH
jgi:hypothetical protein